MIPFQNKKNTEKRRTTVVLSIQSVKNRYLLKFIFQINFQYCQWYLLGEENRKVFFIQFLSSCIFSFWWEISFLEERNEIWDGFLLFKWGVTTVWTLVRIKRVNKILIELIFCRRCSWRPQGKGRLMVYDSF